MLCKRQKNVNSDRSPLLCHEATSFPAGSAWLTFLVRPVLVGLSSSVSWLPESASVSGMASCLCLRDCLPVAWLGPALPASSGSDSPPFSASPTWLPSPSAGFSLAPLLAAPTLKVPDKGAASTGQHSQLHKPSQSFLLSSLSSATKGNDADPDRHKIFVGHEDLYFSVHSTIALFISTREHTLPGSALLWPLHSRLADSALLSTRSLWLSFCSPLSLGAEL